jgi:hypothetical protein
LTSGVPCENGIGGAVMIAEPGGICVSSKVYNEIRRKIDFVYDDLGEQQLKNIAQPVRVYNDREIKREFRGFGQSYAIFARIQRLATKFSTQRNREFLEA